MKSLKLMNLSIFIVLIPFLFYSCSAMFGKEFDRLPIDKISTNDDLHVYSKSLNLKKDEEISLWADFDVEYKGNLSMEYQIIIIIDKTDTLDMTAHDPFNANVTMNSKRISVNGHTDYSCNAKLTTFKAEKDASYEFNVAVFANQAPADFTFNKGDLVFRK